MQPVELMERYITKLKAADKDLRKLEKAAKNLAEKHTATEEQRTAIQDDIRRRESAMDTLQDELGQLRSEFIEAEFQQDVGAKREVQKRREEIDKLLQEHEQSLEQLRTSLDQLDDLAEQSAIVAAQLDALNFGNGYKFAMDLRDALVKNESALSSRQSASRSTLPTFTEATRRKVDSAYREQQERKESEQAKADAKRRDDAEKAKLINKVVRDDEGIVVGVKTYDEEGNYLKYTEAKMV